MNADRKDLVSGALDRMEQHARQMRLAVLAGAALEGLLLIVALMKITWSDSTHVLMFVFSVLGYTIVALGLMALGAHISRVGLRIVSALDDRPSR